MTIFIAFISSFVLSILLTPFVKKLAIRWGVVDKPEARKVHTSLMPRMGGLAIYLSFLITYIILLELHLFEPVRFINAFMLGSLVIVLTGILDDKYQLSPKVKFIGQIIAALIIVFYGEKVHTLNIPLFDESLNLGWLGIPITILWIVGVTNAINLIDGLDGLAAGVSMIAASTLFVVSLLMGNFIVATILIALIGSIFGFLFFNFHPAKIFMGDTGSLFLGFSLATLSLLEFKQVTIITFVLPVLILGVPIVDTLFAMLRRYINHVPITMPDKNHLHHRLLKKGFSHRSSVLIIYGISAVFGLLAILTINLPIWGSCLVILGAFIAMEIFAEVIGLVDEYRFKPLLHIFKKNK